jgi:endonuclease/exonuclease/phosphatase family metal-dependent hydrolase
VQLSFLFWNLQRKPLQSRLARIARHESIDIVAVAENALSDAEIIQELQNQTGIAFEKPVQYVPEKQKVDVFIRSGISTSVEQLPTNRMVIYKINVQNCAPFLLAVAHLHDPINYSEDDRNELAILKASRNIRQAEGDTGITRTILVGDLNMNPFDRGVRGSSGFHAVMTKEIAARESRQVDGESIPFFYNPMWGHFGDRTDGPPGTIYYGSGVATPFWSIYDQVLLRPSLMHSLQELRILDSDGTDSLLTENGIPDVRSASDHLPIKFVLDIQSQDEEP